MGALSCVFLVAVTVRLVLSMLVELPLDGDQRAYWTMASRLAAGEVMQDHYGNHAFHSAGYPMLLGAVFWLTEPSRIAALVVNALLGGTAAVLIGAIAHRLTGSVKACVLTGLVWGSIYVEGVLYSGYLLKENLSIPLLLAQVLAFLFLQQAARPWPWCVALGALSGVQAIVGGSGLFALPVMGGALLLDRRVTVLRRMMRLAIVAVATVAVLAPWLARNEAVIGQAVLNTNGGFNLYIGNHLGASGMFVEPRDTPLGAAGWEALSRQGEVAFNREMKAAAVEHVIAHPFETIRLSVRKALLFWMPPWHEGKTDVGGVLESVARGIWLVQYLMLVALAAWQARKAIADRNVRLFVALLVAYTGVHAVFYVTYRYRLLIMPIVCLLASLSIASGHERWFRRAATTSLAACRPGSMIRS